jgi:hypothetical protein
MHLYLFRDLHRAHNTVLVNAEISVIEAIVSTRKLEGLDCWDIVAMVYGLDGQSSIPGKGSIFFLLHSVQMRSRKPRMRP